MSENAPKHIVIGITGGIAAYKSLALIRLFKAAGWEVKPVATKNALEFVTPLSIETLAQDNLYCDTFSRNFTYDVKHISIADWADAVVVAPATANIIGKFANGIADDALSTLLLAMRKPVFMAPAMNTKMYENEAVQENIRRLSQRGVRFIGPQCGDLACGTRGKGRMEEPDTIFQSVVDVLSHTGKWQGVRAVVTAGPTYEAIDPVRFIGNHSSGRMGFALAEELAAEGALVTLITGSTSLQTNCPNICRVDVTSAAQMAERTLTAFVDCDVAIMSAAVADYTPKVVAERKIKKHDEGLTIELVKTQDILKSLGGSKRENQVLVGFALETDNEMENAIQKLQNKNADFIVLNSLQDENAGFGYATNKVTVIGKEGGVFHSELKDKHAIARDILNIVLEKVKK